MMGEDYGWKNKDQSKIEVHNEWEVLRSNIQNYIKGINFGYKNKLKEIGVDYINAKATFKDQHTIDFEFDK